jgi:hypothetical protein
MSKKKNCTKPCEKLCAAPKLVEDHLEKILLNDDELSLLKSKQQELVTLKVELANFVLYSNRTEKAFAESISNKENEYLEEAKRVALTHGVDANCPDAGNWNLNLDDKTLSKV